MGDLTERVDRRVAAGQWEPFLLPGAVTKHETWILTHGIFSPGVS